MPEPNIGIRIKPLGAIAQAITRLGSLFDPPKRRIEGVSMDNWPTALQPVEPIGPPGSTPLAWPFNYGQNLTYTPRADSELTAADLKALATYPLARICIENTKDMLCRMKWEVQLKMIPGETHKEHSKRKQDDDVASQLTDFFEYPDTENDWTAWLRPLIEDMFVLDAATIYMRRNKAGIMAELRVLRGESIVRYITDEGWTPNPPSPAYAQLWQGIPRVELTTDQLMYRPRNIVPRNTVASHLYGMSPTEQLRDEITVGALRLKSIMAYYEKGSVPGIMQIVPPDVPPEKIAEAMAWLNNDLAGQLEKRRQWRMMQGFAEGGKDQILVLKDPVLADVFDDLHVRKICFGYGTSPQRLMRMMNRATAQINQESAEEEGLAPWADWIEDTMNLIIQRRMGYKDHEFVMKINQEMDIIKQSTADKTWISCGRKTINECREAAGDDPLPQPEANIPGIITGTGFVPLDQVQQQNDMQMQAQQHGQKMAEQGLQQKQQQGKPQPGGNKPPNQAGKPPSEDESDEKLEDEAAKFYDFYTKYSEDQPRVPAGGPGGGEFAGGGGTAVVEHTQLSESEARVLRAKAAYVAANKEEQALADLSEKELSKQLNMPRTADNLPFDLHGERHGIEIKTLIKGKNDKITMNAKALAAKHAYAERYSLKPFTVIVDRRGGEGSKPVYYWRQGVGSYRIRNMTRASSLADLRRQVRG